MLAWVKKKWIFARRGWEEWEGSQYYYIDFILHGAIIGLKKKHMYTYTDTYTHTDKHKHTHTHTHTLSLSNTHIHTQRERRTPCTHHSLFHTDKQFQLYSLPVSVRSVLFDQTTPNALILLSGCENMQNLHERSIFLASIMWNLEMCVIYYS